MKQNDNISVNGLFSVPVYNISHIDGFYLVQDEIEKALPKSSFKKKSESFPSTVQHIGHFVNETGFLGNWISDNKCSHFMQVLDNAVQDYANMIGFPQGMPDPNQKFDYMLQSWVNKFDKGSYGDVHTHTSSDISGVYYYQTTGKDGDFFFETPVDQVTCSEAWVQLSGREIIVPKVGQLMLFPGWIRHGVNENLTDDVRISISWNIKFTGPRKVSKGFKK